MGIKKIICIFGASITEGLWDMEKGGWANRLRFFLGKKALVYNLGIAGETTEDLLKRLENESRSRFWNETEIKDHKEHNVMVISIGTNDSGFNSKNKPRVSLEKFENNLQELLKRSRKFAEKVVFVGLGRLDESKTKPLPWAKEAYYSNENIEKYNAVVKKFCRENGIGFVEILDLLDKKDLDDGIHPDFRGHQKMFEKVKDFLLRNKII